MKAVELRGWGWILLWPALDCLLVGSAYYGSAGRVFGKRPDGSMKGPVVLLMLPFLLVNWTVWHAQVFFTRERAADEVAPGLYLSRRVFERELPEAVTLVVDLTAEFPKPVYSARRGYLCLPTLDAFVPEEAAFLAAARRAAAHEGGVLIHCANGRGRSAAFMAAVLMAKGTARSLAEAEEMIVKARPSAAFHPAQRALLEGVGPELLSSGQRRRAGG
ncbi:MAG TPA: hypothetical protein DCM05_13615 [Elusimicrobia bacterium]|nr:hypothetical protein [Elusimicrobiota bacterium]